MQKVLIIYKQNKLDQSSLKYTEIVHLQIYLIMQLMKVFMQGSCDLLPHGNWKRTSKEVDSRAISWMGGPAMIYCK